MRFDLTSRNRRDCSLSFVLVIPLLACTLIDIVVRGNYKKSQNLLYIWELKGARRQNQLEYLKLR